MNKTALYDKHVALGAKMGEFAGWLMPMSYLGVVGEHDAVRKQMGLFDVSHMGRIDIKGDRAPEFLDYISTNVISDRAPFTAAYTVICSETGGCVDDTVIFCLDSKNFFAIANAGNRETTLAHLKRYSKRFNVTVKERYDNYGILALQGPESEGLLRRLLGHDIALKYMQMASCNYAGEEFLLSRTGYTGSLGYELFGPDSVIVNLWDYLLRSGREDGLVPVGLAARDILRLEAGFALYDHELALDIAPTESVSEWTVRWKKDDFLGKEALLRLEVSPKKRTQHAVTLIDKGIARHGNTVYKNGRVIGTVTSGNFSPSLDRSIAIIMVNASLALGETIEIEVRGQKLSAKVVKLPFYRG